MKIGIIGNGFVGGAIINAFKNKKDIDLYVYDSIEIKSKNCLEQTVNSDITFVCLPTPMKNIEGGEADLSIIESFFEKVSFFNSKSIFLIKSTIPVGTTKNLQERFNNLCILHNPEFLTARFANEDFLNADRHIVGGMDEEAKEKIKSFYLSHFPKIPVFLTSSDESELIKYCSNCFFATKVSFFNEIKLFSENIGADYSLIISALTADKRIENSHTQVPGHDGDYGFGGYCYPKDINAFMRTLDQSKKASGSVLRAIWERNKEIRKKWDWKNSKSSVSS